MLEHGSNLPLYLLLGLFEVLLYAIDAEADVQAFFKGAIKTVPFLWSYDFQALVVFHEVLIVLFHY